MVKSPGRKGLASGLQLARESYCKLFFSLGSHFPAARFIFVGLRTLGSASERDAWRKEVEASAAQGCISS